MKKIRVLLANCPQKIGEFEVRELIGPQEDMEVVDEVQGSFNVLQAVREKEAHAVILGVKDLKEENLCSHLLAQYPNLTILCLTSKDEIAFIAMDLSEANILNALRQPIPVPSS